MEVRTFSALQVQNQMPRAVETSCQGPARGLVAELGTGSRPELCHLCRGGSAAYSFAFVVEKLVRFSRLLSPSLWWIPLKYQQRLIIFWMATTRHNWRGVMAKRFWNFPEFWRWDVNSNCGRSHICLAKSLGRNRLSVWRTYFWFSVTATTDLLK